MTGSAPLTTPYFFRSSGVKPNMPKRRPILTYSGPTTSAWLLVKCPPLKSQVPNGEVARCRRVSAGSRAKLVRRFSSTCLRPSLSITTRSW